MTLAVLPDLDVETIEELTPPCEAAVCLCTPLPCGDLLIVDSKPCTAAATVAVLVRCRDCTQTGHVLLCDQHEGQVPIATHGVDGCDGELDVLDRTALR